MFLTKNDLKNLEKETAPFITDAGRIIMNNWNTIHKLNYKDKRDFSSNIDIQVENKLRNSLHTLYPQAGFIVEEGKSDKLPEYNWLIDPIDGTKYYVNKTPMFLTQIALIKNDIPILGQVYNPVSKQLFSASLGNGAYLNNKKIIDSTRPNVSEAIIDINYGGFDYESSWKLKVVASLAKKFYRIRITGNYLFIYMATGSIDASIDLHKDTKSVDIMPGIIIFKEVGLTTDFIKINKKRKILVSSNKILFNKIKLMVQNS